MYQSLLDTAGMSQQFNAAITPEQVAPEFSRV